MVKKKIKKEKEDLTRLEDELRQNPLLTEEAIKVVDECIYTVWDTYEHYYKEFGNENRLRLSEDEWIKLICKLVKYTIRIKNYYSHFLDRCLRDMIDNLNGKYLNEEQKDIILDLKTTYHKQFVASVSTVEFLEEKRNIINGLEGIVKS